MITQTYIIRYVIIYSNGKKTYFKSLQVLLKKKSPYKSIFAIWSLANYIISVLYIYQLILGKDDAILEHRSYHPAFPKHFMSKNSKRNEEKTPNSQG